MPSKLKYLGQYAFEECASLSVVNFSDNLVNLLDGTFKSCDISDFQSLNLPLQLSSIPKICFLDCKSLKELDLSKFEKLQTINNYAFYGCLSLETIIFPSNVQDIKMLAFGNCPLKKVIFKGLEIKSTRVPPKASIILLIGPTLRSKNSKTKEQSTTSDRKWGAYVTIWTVFLNFKLEISFKINAKMIEHGKVAKEYKVIRKVFLIITQKSG